MRRHRLRKWSKWACTVAAGVTLALGVISRFYRFERYSLSRDGMREWSVVERQGLVTVQSVGGDQPLGDAYRTCLIIGELPGWDWGYGEDAYGYRFTEVWHAGLLWWRGSNGWCVGTTFLYPFLLTATPAALLWYKDRRRSGPGLCTKCGYPRTGLAPDAKCPECGTAPPRG